MNKFLLCALVIVLVLVSGVLLWRYTPLISIIKTRTPAVTNSDVTRYPVDQNIAEKIKKVGLTPLYQLNKDDPEGRSVAYEDADGFEGYQVLDLKQVPNTADYYITVKNIDANVAESERDRATFDVRFVGENSPESSQFRRSKTYINRFADREELPVNTNINLADLVKKNDVIRIEFQGDVELRTFNSDGNKNPVINFILIQRAHD